MATKPKKDDPEQSERFKKTARELEVNEDPKAFDQRFVEIAAAAPKRGASRAPK